MTVRIQKASEIISVADVAKKITALTYTNRQLFRGQTCDKPLLPKIARDSHRTASEVLAIERRMLERFRKESSPFFSGPLPQTDWDWLSVAQHYGMPTRLLDWSASALAALWFAVATDPPAGEKHSVLWRLQVEEKDLKSPGDLNNIFALRRTYVFQPFHIDKRIAAQAGWFSVHKYVEESDRFVALDMNKSYVSKLQKWIIPRDKCGQIRRELRLMGVTQATLFPDLGGLCADIQDEQLNLQQAAKEI
jgi:hypothetical protein